jgi:hypothetical protein
MPRRRQWVSAASGTPRPIGPHAVSVASACSRTTATSKRSPATRRRSSGSRRTVRASTRALRPSSGNEGARPRRRCRRRTKASATLQRPVPPSPAAVPQLCAAIVVTERRRTASIEKSLPRRRAGRKGLENPRPRETRPRARERRAGGASGTATPSPRGKARPGHVQLRAEGPMTVK